MACQDDPPVSEYGSMEKGPSHRDHYDLQKQHPHARTPLATLGANALCKHDYIGALEEVELPFSTTPEESNASKVPAQKNDRSKWAAFNSLEMSVAPDDNERMPQALKWNDKKSQDLGTDWESVLLTFQG